MKKNIISAFFNAILIKGHKRILGFFHKHNMILTKALTKKIPVQNEYSFTYACFSISQNSVESETQGFEGSGGVRKESYSLYCSPKPIYLK